jgi:hypothetical protein
MSRPRFETPSSAYERHRAHTAQAASELGCHGDIGAASHSETGRSTRAIIRSRVDNSCVVSLLQDPPTQPPITTPITLASRR